MLPPRLCACACACVSTRACVSPATLRFIDNAREDLTACWSVWVPALIVNFTICPMWARVPFVAMVSVGWVAYISFTRGEHTVSGIAAEATDADAASTMAIESSSS